MRKLLLALIAVVAFVVTPASADARTVDPQPDCVVAAMAVGDFRGAVACGDEDGPTANSRFRNIDWD